MSSGTPVLRWCGRKFVRAQSASLPGCSIAAVSSHPAQLPMPRIDSGPVASAAAQRAGSFSALSVRLSGTVMISASCARVSATYSTRISSLKVSVRMACASAA